MSRLLIISFFLLLMSSCDRKAPTGQVREPLAGPERAAAAAERARPKLQHRFRELGFTRGAEVFIRAFKEEAVLELFLRQPGDGPFVWFRSYPIVAASGDLGPKLAESDRQVPEGFYQVTRASMKSDSRFHLAMNLGFPNAYDRAHQRTGSFLMIHGGRASVGCLAMTDEKIEEIYTLCDEAHSAGQELISVHLFPFRFSAERMAATADLPWHEFWRNLSEGDALFEAHRIPPKVSVTNGRYQFQQISSRS